eukprot:PhF_6_TR13868/c0_g1_i2/m.22251
MANQLGAVFVDDVWGLIFVNLPLQSVNTLRCTNKHINNVILRTQPYGIHVLLSMHYDEEMKIVARTRDKIPCNTVLWVMDLLQFTHFQKPHYWSPHMLSIRNLLNFMKEVVKSPNAHRRTQFLEQGWKIILSPSGGLLQRMQSHPQDRDAFCLRCGSWFNMWDSPPPSTSDDADVMVCVYHRSYHHMAYGSWGDDLDYWTCCHSYDYDNPGCARDNSHRSLRLGKSKSDMDSIVEESTVKQMGYFLYEKVST